MYILTTNQCTRIANARFFDGYLPAKKWVIAATFASPQSRDFKRYMLTAISNLKSSYENNNKYFFDSFFFLNMVLFVFI